MALMRERLMYLWAYYLIVMRRDNQTDDRGSIKNLLATAKCVDCGATDPDPTTRDDLGDCPDCGGVMVVPGGFD